LDPQLGDVPIRIDFVTQRVVERESDEFPLAIVEAFMQLLDERLAACFPRLVGISGAFSQPTAACSNRAGRRGHAQEITPVAGRRVVTIRTGMGRTEHDQALRRDLDVSNEAALSRTG
jgi:hypothetical protein